MKPIRPKWYLICQNTSLKSDKTIYFKCANLKRGTSDWVRWHDARRFKSFYVAKFFIRYYKLTACQVVITYSDYKSRTP